MTTITANMIADSISPEGIRLSTMQLRYPRPIHSEFLAHRVMSRNASSSRAIPVERLIKDVLDDPFVPLHWGKNQKGMQADEECNARVHIDPNDVDREEAWWEGMEAAVRLARAFSEAGYHKQIVNRLLEPFAHINVVVTATEWANFLHLRDHKDAEPHIAILAREVRKAMDGSEPSFLLPGQWHLPYVDDEDIESFGLENDEDQLDLARKLSVARCASVSYKTVDGQPMTIARAIDLYDKLVGAEPLHASPTEHQATPDTLLTGTTALGWIRLPEQWKRPDLHKNLRGWIQFRATLPGENISS